MLILFDVDGTLTPSRGVINDEFKHWLMNELKAEFRLITGSDPEKTQEQVGYDLWSYSVSYNCAGNHVFHRGKETYKSEWKVPDTLLEWMQDKLNDTDWMIKTGRHIEQRVGLCNFSTLGRNATSEQRKAYYEWDRNTHEREMIAKYINTNWGDIECTIAGETGVDIYKKGTGKDQVLKTIDCKQPIRFFGDRQDPTGNDYSLAQAILTSKVGLCYHVKNWQHTWMLLKDINAEVAQW